jgi:hypothetical protein
LEKLLRRAFDMINDILIVLGLTAALSLAALLMFGVQRPKDSLEDCVSDNNLPSGVQRLADQQGAAALEMTAQFDFSVLIAMGATTVRRAVAMEDLRVSIRAGRVSVRIRGLPRAKLDLAPCPPGDWDRVEQLIRVLASPSSRRESQPDGAP